MYHDRSAAAIDASIGPFSLFCATAWKAAPGLMTVITPSSDGMKINPSAITGDAV
jgi:hypothetical protein